MTILVDTGIGDRLRIYYLDIAAVCIATTRAGCVFYDVVKGQRKNSIAYCLWTRLLFSVNIKPNGKLSVAATLADNIPIGIR